MNDKKREQITKLAEIEYDARKRYEKARDAVTAKEQAVELAIAHTEWKQANYDLTIVSGIEQREAPPTEAIKEVDRRDWLACSNCDHGHYVLDNVAAPFLPSIRLSLYVCKAVERRDQWWVPVSAIEKVLDKWKSSDTTTKAVIREVERVLYSGWITCPL